MRADKVVLQLWFMKMEDLGEGKGELATQLGSQGLKVASGGFERPPKGSLGQIFLAILTQRAVKPMLPAFWEGRTKGPKTGGSQDLGINPK